MYVSDLSFKVMCFLVVAVLIVAKKNPLFVNFGFVAFSAFPLHIHIYVYTGN